MKKEKKVTLAELVDLPEGILQAYSIEIFAGKEILFNGNFEITELEPTMLKLKNHEHRIEMEGNDLMICDYEEDGVRVRGAVNIIRFNEEKER